MHWSMAWFSHLNPGATWDVSGNATCPHWLVWLIISRPCQVLLDTFTQVTKICPLCRGLPTHLPSAFVTIYLDLALSPRHQNLSFYSRARGLAGLSAKWGHGDNIVNEGTSWRLSLLSLLGLRTGSPSPCPGAQHRHLPQQESSRSAELLWTVRGPHTEKQRGEDVPDEAFLPPCKILWIYTLVLFMMVHSPSQELDRGGFLPRRQEYFQDHYIQLLYTYSLDMDSTRYFFPVCI